MLLPFHLEISPLLTKLVHSRVSFKLLELLKLLTALCLVFQVVELMLLFLETSLLVRKLVQPTE